MRFTRLRVSNLKNIRLITMFPNRHIGNTKNDLELILKKINVSNKSELIAEICPENIRNNLKYFDKLSENDALSNLNNIMQKNKIKKNLIGLDFHDTLMPYPIQRLILENPDWYTPYTPYQSEISQGRLEAQFNFQTLITELTGLPISNISLLDSGSAASEAVNMSYNIKKGKRTHYFVDKEMHPILIDILKTRCEIMGINLIIDNVENIDINDNLLGFMFSYPNKYGDINQHRELLKLLKKNGTIISCHADLMSLMLLKSPGEIGVDIAFGNTQRFGLPLGFGGPHAAFFSTKKENIRHMPGRIIGESKDSLGNKCFRIALQTREQHIKKDKATSNICTSQALLSTLVSMYAIYHQKNGLKAISKNIHIKTSILEKYLTKNPNIKMINKSYYDTLSFYINNGDYYVNKMNEKGYSLLCKNNNLISLSLNETINNEDLSNIINIFTNANIDEKDIPFLEDISLDKNYLREDNFLKQYIFNSVKTETELMRYIKKLEKKDYSLRDGMVPLGSCTMKLNSVSELLPLSWDNVQKIHPYTPDFNLIGYKEMIDELTELLKNVTGFEYGSYQSNSGAMGEYTGLLCIQKYHRNNNQKKRNLCLIPKSAHGTNFASAKLAGLDILTYDDNSSLEEFQRIVKKNNNKLSCLMITYPNTYGIFNDDIKDIIDIIHDNGGLVYMDGANMNAQVGITSPGYCGADVCHLNLHKTFCIPHGGGGPGMGPIFVNEKLKNYLPNNNLQSCNNIINDSIGTITLSNFSSASILNITYQYLKMMGSQGLKDATEMALINSNYLKDCLKDHYEIYITNKYNRVGHEFIIKLDEFKKIGINDTDIAKRLMDYSFHSPTMSWPVSSSLMIEPTESESKEELDRFIDAMICIRYEIKEIEDGIYDRNNNVLKNSPHTVGHMIDWKFPYSVEKAYFPIDSLKLNKFWPTVGRVDNLVGDKALLK